MAKRRSIAIPAGCLAALTMFLCQPGQAAAAELALTASTPPGFADLEGPREVVVDVFYRGQRLGVARATTTPGSLRFKDPAAVVELLAPHADAPEIREALTSAFPSNAGQACSRMLSTGCGTLDPKAIGLIFDESRFRVDLFLSNELLGRPLSTEIFLSPSSEQFAAVGTLGAAISGTTSDDPNFNMQGRAIVSLGSSRLKSNISYSSELGVVADDLLVEVDRPNRRYMAGLFWTPGTSLVGRRRIMGVGTATQYDTRADRQRLEGTPLPLFVQQRSIVEILVDGRLVSSQVVEAGNQLLDSSGLPEGSYPLVLRVREQSGETREERRFFVKDESLAPAGQTRFQAFAGLIAPTRRGRPVSLSDSFFYQLGASRRIAENIGVQQVLLGTQKKLVSETSIALLAGKAQVRLTALASSAGEYGGVLQLSSAGSGRLHYSFDLRKVWDRKGGGLIPGSFGGTGFDSETSALVPDLGGDYTQFNATLGYGIGNLSFRLFASYSDADGSGRDFSIGPNVDWLVARGSNFQLRAEADALKSRHATAGYVGLRFLFTGRGFSSSGSAGYRAQDHEGAGTSGRYVSNMNTEWSGVSEDWGRYSIGAGLERATDGTQARARGSLDSSHGNLRADLLHNFSGRTQYSLGVQTGAALGPALAVGGYQIRESALIVEVEGEGRGDAKAGEFEVLVDETPYARVTAGGRTTIFLQPYRDYSVRLRPIAAASVHFDGSARKVTLFPGNVDRLSWKATTVFTLFGRVVDNDGNPIANAVLEGDHGTGSSDGEGYFQIDVAANDAVTLRSVAGETCQLAVGRTKPSRGFSSVGKVVCQ